MGPVQFQVPIDEIDVVTEGEFRTFVEQAVAQAANDEGTVTFDFSQVGFIDSRGLQVLVDTQRDLLGQSRSLRIVSAPSHIQRLLTVTGLDEFLGDPATGPAERPDRISPQGPRRSPPG